MDKLRKEDRSTLRIVIPRVLKALIKTAIIYALFTIFSALLVPLEGFYDYQMLFAASVTTFMFFVFIIELSRGTIFHHIFSIANSLMIVLCFAYMLNEGLINFTIEHFRLVVDLRFFLSIFVLGGLLGFARSMLRLLNWMNEREEQWLKYQIETPPRL